MEANAASRGFCYTVAVRSSESLFDSEYYAAQLPRARLSRSRLYEHFMTEGWKQGLNPHPLFDVHYYQRQACLSHKVHPLEHYLGCGPLNPISPHPLFDMMLYWKSVPPWSRSETPLQYYLATGWKRGVNPCPYFDPEFYREQLRALPRETDPLIHYLTRGWRAGLSPSRYFDTRFYLQQNPGLLRAGTNPLLHFVTRGEGGRARPHPLLSRTLFEQLQAPPIEPLHPPKSLRLRKIPQKSRKRKIIFLHIPKAAGTSLRTWLRWNIPHGRLLELPYKPWLFRGFEDEVKAVLKEYEPELAALAGPCLYGIHEWLPQSDCRYFTFLREPVERLVSWYRYSAVRKDLPFHSEIRAGMSLREFALAAPRAQNENFMSRMISGMGYLSHPDENDPLVLERALENIRKDFCLVATVDRFEQGLARAARIFGFGESRVPELNHNAVPVSRLDRKTIRIIRERNELDLKLYARIRKG